MTTPETKSLQHVTIFTDGGCKGNPGPGGYGVVMIYGPKRREISGGFRRTTNNRMELMAAIVGLETLRHRCAVTIHTDSQYMSNGIERRWAIKWRRDHWLRDGKPVPNADLWARLLDLCDAHEVTFQWVRGHAGNPENERCDQLAVAAAAQPNLPIDEGYLAQSERRTHCGLELTHPEDRTPHPAAAAATSGAASEASKGPITEAGQPCRKCGTPVIRMTPKGKPKPDQAYYFEYYMSCPGCGTSYMVDAAKRSTRSGSSAS
jgi:ribonuclease HI